MKCTWAASPPAPGHSKPQDSDSLLAVFAQAMAPVLLWPPATPGAPELGCCFSRRNWSPCSKKNRSIFQHQKVLNANRLHQPQQEETPITHMVSRKGRFSKARASIDWILL